MRGFNQPTFAGKHIQSERGANPAQDVLAEPEDDDHHRRRGPRSHSRHCFGRAPQSRGHLALAEARDSFVRARSSFQEILRHQLFSYSCGRHRIRASSPAICFRSISVCNAVSDTLWILPAL